MQRLQDTDRLRLVAHFLALPAKDRRMRFGTPLGTTGIAAYARAIDFARDAVFGVEDARRTLLGVAHVAFPGGDAEIGLSVVPLHRGLGLGMALFRHGLAHARRAGAGALVMRYLVENAAIVRIARAFGMRIVVAGGEADARLDLAPMIVPPSLTVPSAQGIPESASPRAARTTPSSACA
ncbi:MAG: GNAT family N-acetyltransferase [Rudaea sp.]